MAIKLYHYSSIKLSELKTPKTLGVKSRGKVRTETIYGTTCLDRISVFTQPLPANLLDLLECEHDKWKEGVYYEHIIEIDKDEDLHFFVRENKSRMDFEEHYEPDWTPELKQKWWDDLEEMTFKAGFYGDTFESLKANVDKINEKPIKEMFIESIKRGWFNNFQYAAGVPHLELAPKSGRFKVASCKRLKLKRDKGSDMVDWADNIVLMEQGHRNKGKLVWGEFDYD